MEYRDGWTPIVMRRDGLEGTAVVERLVRRVPEADNEYPYVHAATRLLAEAAGWAYADEFAFRDVMARAGLSDAEYRLISVTNDAMFVDGIAYLVRSQCRRLAILSFRGTMPKNVTDWFTDASVSPMQFRELGVVHGGFYRNVVAMWPAIWARLDEFIGQKLEALYITGHSLGGAMAALAAMTLRYDEEYARARPLLRGVYTFGQPMVAEPSLAAQCEADLGHIVFRHVFEHDLVPRLPPWTTGPFQHFGREYGSVNNQWQRRDSVASQVSSALLGMSIGSVAWMLRQLALSRWIDLPFSMDDHSPVHYVECSQQAPGGSLGGVSVVIPNPKNISKSSGRRAVSATIEGNGHGTQRRTERGGGRRDPDGDSV